MRWVLSSPSETRLTAVTFEKLTTFCRFLVKTAVRVVLINLCVTWNLVIKLIRAEIISDRDDKLAMCNTKFNIV
jgi:hypothetical protein